MFDNITKTYVGKPGEEEDTPIEEVTEEEVVEETPENEEVVDKKKKYKLQKKKIKLIVVGGLTTAAVVFSAVKINEYNKMLEKYEDLKNDNDLRTSTIHELVNPNLTSVDELLDQDIAQYKEYEKFRSLINARRRYIEPDMDLIEQYKTSTYDVDYNGITLEHIQDLDKEFNKCHMDMEDHPTNCTASRTRFIEICNEFYSIRESINKYEAEYGKELVSSVADKVLASKVVDFNGLDPEYVSNIEGKYGSNGKLKVSFDYDNSGKKEHYKATFKNDGYDRAKDIAKDVSDGNYLDAIHETKILADDNLYDNFDVKKTR